MEEELCKFRARLVVDTRNLKSQVEKLHKRMKDVKLEKDNGWIMGVWTVTMTLDVVELAFRGGFIEWDDESKAIARRRKKKRDP